MDRISGLMPQIGWSPLLTPAAPKKAPASTVEPAAKSANINSGMGAQVDTQTAQDRAQQVTDLKAQAESLAPLTQATQHGAQSASAGAGGGASSMAGTLLAAELVAEGESSGSVIEPPPDPDAPTGPPPTFDVTPLEAQAARRLDPPETASTEVAEIAPPEAEAPLAVAESASHAAEATASATVASEPGTSAQPAPVATETAAAQGDWQRLETGGAEPSLDVTR